MMQATQTTKHSARPRDLTDGPGLIAWCDEAFAALNQSEWASLLDVAGVSVLEALRQELVLRTRDHLRGKPQGGRQPWWKRSLEQGRQLAYRVKIDRHERRAAAKSAAVQKADVVIWPRDPTHYRGQLPVYRALGERGTSVSVFACNPAIFDQVRAQDVPVISPRAAWPEALAAARRDGRKAARELARLGSASTSFPTLGDTRQLAASWHATLVRFLPFVHEAVVNCQQLCERTGARVILVGYDITVEGRTACLLAPRYGARTACLMHGSMASSPLHYCHLAEYWMVYGEQARRQLMAYGMSEERISVCGAPYLDQRPRQSGRLDPTISERLGLDAQRPTVLVANSGPGHSISHAHHGRLIRSIMRLSAAMPEVQFVAKLHPKDRLDYYEQAKADVPESRLHMVAHRAEGYPREIFTWLQGVRVLLTGASATAFEAMLLDVPVVTIDLADEISDVDFIDAGATLHVETDEALSDAVTGLLAGSEVRAGLQSRVDAYLKDAFYALDGHSAARAAEALEGLLAGPARAEV